MKSVVALAHYGECTKELISGLPNFGSTETFGARAEKRTVLAKKTAADVLPLSLLSGLLAISKTNCGECNTGAQRAHAGTRGMRAQPPIFVSLLA